MKTIVFNGLNDDQIVDILDSTIPFILIPAFRPHLSRRWRATGIDLDASRKLENVTARDLVVDLMVDKRAVEQIFSQCQFNQIALLQFTRPIPDTLKIDELPAERIDSILIQNGLVNRIWVNYEHVEFSSVDDAYFERIKGRYKANSH